MNKGVSNQKNKDISREKIRTEGKIKRIRRKAIILTSSTEKLTNTNNIGKKILK